MNNPLTRVSEWYVLFGYCTFPTLFIRLNGDEKRALLGRDRTSKTGRGVAGKIQQAIDWLPGNCFVHADLCAPTDSPLFIKRNGSANTGTVGWQMLCESDKVRVGVEAGEIALVCVHSYRRMDRGREFRLFVRDSSLVAMSQRYPDRHYPRLHAARASLWHTAQTLLAAVATHLGDDDCVMDIYITSKGVPMIIDMNLWGPPTEPLLLRRWDRDWTGESGIHLAPKPVNLKGEVSVSF